MRKLQESLLPYFFFHSLWSQCTFACLATFFLLPYLHRHRHSFFLSFTSQFSRTLSLFFKCQLYGEGNWMIDLGAQTPIPMRFFFFFFGPKPIRQLGCVAPPQSPGPSWYRSQRVPGGRMWVCLWRGCRRYGTVCRHVGPGRHRWRRRSKGRGPAQWWRTTAGTARKTITRKREIDILLLKLLGKYKWQICQNRIAYHKLRFKSDWGNFLSL